MVKVLGVGHAQSGVGWEHIAPYVGEEARHVWELYESDRVREFYLRADHRPGAVLIFECDDATEAERLVAGLPIVEAGWLKFEVVPCVLTQDSDSCSKIRAKFRSGAGPFSRRWEPLHSLDRA
jgi:hypothetical protein